MQAEASNCKLEQQRRMYERMVEEIEDEDILNRPKGLELDGPLLIYIYDDKEEEIVVSSTPSKRKTSDLYSRMVEEIEDEDLVNQPHGLGLNEPLLMSIYDKEEEILILPTLPFEEKLDKYEIIEDDESNDPLIFEYHIPGSGPEVMVYTKPTRTEIRAGIPQIATPCHPTLHSSTVKRNSMGEEDPYELQEVFIAAMHDHAQEFSNLTKITDEDIPRIRESWFDRCQDILGGVSMKLPPL